eukprot:scaffold818_cov64-Phaeocystis_antarctica.AAC.19
MFPRGVSAMLRETLDTSAPVTQTSTTLSLQQPSFEGKALFSAPTGRDPTRLARRKDVSPVVSRTMSQDGKQQKGTRKCFPANDYGTVEHTRGHAVNFLDEWLTTNH